MPPNAGKNRSSFTPVADRFLRSTGRVADQGFNAVAKQNASVTDYWASRSSLLSSMQQLNLNSAAVHHYSRRIHRRRLQFIHYMTYGKYPAIPIRVWQWCRDELLLRLLDVLWAYVQPILLSVFCTLLTLALIILGNALFFGTLYLLLTT